jgi:hypothetical protein
VDDFVAEKGDEASSSQALSDENQAKAEGNPLLAANGCSRPSQGC